MSLSRQILRALRSKPATGTDIAKALGEKPKNVSGTLSRLHRSRLLSRERSQELRNGRPAFVYRVGL
jgi:predicted ArsR family transcriptional regulator